MKIWRTLVVTMLTLGSIVTVQAPASAQGPHADSCMVDVYYDTPYRESGFRGTNEVSFQVGGPGTITWTDSGTVTQAFGANASVSISASAIIAEAKSTFGISYTYSTASTRSWSYSTTIPAGSTGVLAILHRSDRITTDKKTLQSNCTWRTDHFYSYVSSPAVTNVDYCVFRDLYPYSYANWRAACASE